jgi:hypothetical protein
MLIAELGFGDFVPTAPVGRIVWIPYALMSVPIVTSFAGQTITGLVSVSLVSLPSLQTLAAGLSPVTLPPAVYDSDKRQPPKSCAAPG